MLSKDQQKKAIDRVKHFINMANEQYGADMKMPKVIFNKRGTVGGTANHGKYELNFNAGLMLDNWDHYMNDTIPHEVAHLVKNEVYGIARDGERHRPHGYYWQSIMIGFGCDPARTHNMDTSRVAQHKTKYVYKCSCCDTEVVVGPKVHRNILNSKKHYWHKGCRTGHLVYVRNAGQVSYKDAKEQKQPTPKQSQKSKTKAPVSVIKPKSGTKISIALSIFEKVSKTKNSSRQGIIKAIADGMGITPHQAAGYYQNCKKKLGV